MNTIKTINEEFEMFIVIFDVDSQNNSEISGLIKFGVAVNSEFIKRAANSLRGKFFSKFDSLADDCCQGTYQPIFPYRGQV